MRKSATGFRAEMLVLFYAVRHRSTPLWPKLVAGFSLCYLVSPVDLIPDIIPFAGWLDDLLIVPALLHLSYRLLPAAVVRESRLRADGQRRRLRFFTAGIILLLMILTGVYCYHRYRN